MAFEVLTYGDPAADTLLIQMVDDHDLEVIEALHILRKILAKIYRHPTILLKSARQLAVGRTSPT